MLADRESSYEWEREGQPTVEAFQDAAEIELEVAEDVLAILNDKYACYDPSDMDGETEFSAECHYEERKAIESPEHLTISLNAGEWKDEKLTPYKVIVHWLIRPAT